jgi:hypothetical protein
MKKLTKNKKNIYVLAWSQVVAVCTILNLVCAQTINTNSTQLDTGSKRQEKALGVKTDSSPEECPMCNLSEVSWRLCESAHFSL